MTYDDCIEEDVSPTDSIAALKTAKASADETIVELRALHDEKRPEWEEAEAEAHLKEKNETEVAQVKSQNFNPGKQALSVNCSTHLS